MIFNYDWWFGNEYRARIDEAKRRCATSHFPRLDAAAAGNDKEFQKFLSEVESRSIVYLRDGFSYEIKELVHPGSTSALSFECAPADDAYKVGAFIVTVPFDDIARVEIFAVHPREKPEDLPSIKGFGSAQPPHGKRIDDRPVRLESSD